jgi:hypothetical protein
MSMTFDLFAVPSDVAKRLEREPAFFHEVTATYNHPAAKSCSLEKAWHGLHYLLTGTAWETDGPAAFIVAGGREIEGSNGGYGAARLFTPDQTRQIETALS